MNRLLTILIIMLLLPIAAVRAAVSVVVGGDGEPLPQFIIVADGDKLPVITDDDLLRKGVAVRFRVNSSRIAANDEGFARLRKAIVNIPPRYKFCRLLVLRGSASPEGPADNNRRLAHRRARALVDSLSRYVSLPDSTVEERFVNEDYAGLYTLVAQSSMPYKEEILTEIGNSDDDAVIKRRLQSIDGGRAWRLLLRDYFPRLRATRVLMVVEPREMIAPPAAEHVDTIVRIDTIYRTDSVKQDTVAVVTPPLEEPREVVVPEETAVFHPYVAIKSNLLYDAALTPNIEIERWFGKNNKWSVMAEWNFPWWQWHHKERVYEVNEFGLELRRWLFNGSCPNRQTLTRDAESGKWQRDKSKHWWLTGHFIAFYLAGGYYDLEWRYHGEQGDIYSAGFTYGYAIRLSRHWNMEFSASLGYIYSPYTHYEAEHRDDILFAKYKKSFNYFGPTKLKVSLVWLIGKTKHKK